MCFCVLQIDYARKNMNSANQKLQDAQQQLYDSWVEWRKNTGQNDEDDSRSAEVEVFSIHLQPLRYIHYKKPQYLFCILHWCWLVQVLPSAPGNYATEKLVNGENLL